MKDSGKDLAVKIRVTIAAHFPHAYIESYWSRGLASCITVRFALGHDKTEWTNGIIQNDPAFSCFLIWGFDDEGNQLEKGLTLEASIVGYRDKTGYSKLGWRDIKKPVPQCNVIIAFDRYFSRLAAAVVREADAAA